MALGYPATSPYSPYSPYGLPLPSSASAPCTDPLCRDPSCPTFALRAAQAQMMAASSLLPPGYPPVSPYSHLSPYHSLPGMLPPSLLPPSMAPPPPHLQPPPPTTSTPTSSSSASPASLGTSPYLCSWMQGRDFCGRRFNSSEELMSHLRSHTANMGEGSQQAGAGAAPQTPALALLQAQAAQMRSHQQASPPNTSSPTPPSSSPSLSLPPHLQLPISSPGSLPPHLLPPSSTSASSPSSRYLEAAVAASRYHPYGRPSISAQELQGLASLGRPHSLPPSLPPHLLSSLYGAPRPSLPVLP